MLLWDGSVLCVRWCDLRGFLDWDHGYNPGSSKDIKENRLLDRNKVEKSLCLVYQHS